MGHDHLDEGKPELNRLILEIVLRDFEPFETIVAKLSMALPDTCTDEVQQLLLALLADDLVGAYLIHAEPPYYTAVDATLETLECYWFLITEKGKRYFQPTSEPRAEVLQE